MTRWVADELRYVDLGDRRLNKRVMRVTEKLSEKPTASIPVAMGNWTETKAAYRLFASPR